MRLIDLVRPWLPPAAVIALVGAGGKTSTLFRLAFELAAECPAGALMTTTTQILDPRQEPGRVFDAVVLDSGPPWTQPPAAADRGPLLVLAAATGPAGKLQGIHPDRIPELRRAWPYIIVEADGSKRRPVKAPAPYEPALPDPVDLVLGLIGLDCLGRPMEAEWVHRPERFGPVTGCAPGALIRPGHLAALCRSEHGLFQGVPAGTRRLLLLNQADRCRLAPRELIRQLGATGADRVAVCALGNSDPEAAVLAHDGVG